MKGILFTILSGLSYVNLSAQTGMGVNFTHNMNWLQVKEKAGEANKLIFVECFASWCSPCKRMEHEVFSMPEVSNYLNANFVSIRVQFDTANTPDGKDFQDWREQAHEMEREYNVFGFPSFLFFTSQGKLVHRGYGFMNSRDFLALAKQSLDPEQQIYTLLDKFRLGQLAYVKMPALIDGLKYNGEMIAAHEIADYYISNYLLKLMERNLFTRENIRLIASNFEDSKSVGFSWFYHNGRIIDSVLYEGYAFKTVEHIILKQEIIPQMQKWDKLGRIIIKQRDWEKLYIVVKTKYNLTYADRTLLDAEIKWYTRKKQWNLAADLNVKKIEKYKLDTSYLGAGMTNDMIYNIVLMHDREHSILKKAINWMRIICDTYPDNQDFLDTYANLLYKMGDLQMALKLEEKAVSMNKKDNKAIIENMAKMKSGKPTWLVN